MKKLFSFRQNNSGGSFHGPAVNVFVEADTLDEACSKTEPHFSLCGESGLYAEYDSCGCCPCCGHRWSKPWDDEPTKDAEEWIKKSGTLYMRATASAIIKKDGSILVGDTDEKVSEILSYIQSA